MTFTISYNIKWLGIPFLLNSPVCYGTVPIGKAAWLVMFMLMLMYAVIYVSEVRSQETNGTNALCSNTAVIAMIVAVWIICVLEAFIIAFVVAPIQTDPYNVCFLTKEYSPNSFINFTITINILIPMVIMFIFGWILIHYSCKANAGCGQNAPVIWMCLLTPMMLLPKHILELVSQRSHDDLGSYLSFSYGLAEFAWILLPLYLLKSMNVRKECKKIFCKCCPCRAPPEDDNEADEATSLALK